MKRPIIYLIISLLSGILSYEFFIVDISFILVFISILTIFYIKAKNIAIVSLLFFVIGFLFTSIYRDSNRVLNPVFWLKLIIDFLVSYFFVW